MKQHNIKPSPEEIEGNHWTVNAWRVWTIASVFTSSRFAFVTGFSLLLIIYKLIQMLVFEGFAFSSFQANSKDFLFDRLSYFSHLNLGFSFKER